jgi:hypothetical protein
LNAFGAARILWLPPKEDDEMIHATANRRRLGRSACILTVTYRASGAWHPATAMDLSTSGCRLRLGQDLPQGSAVTVRFDVPLRDGASVPSLDVPATVMWCRQEGLTRHAGIHFASAPSALQELLRELR